MTGNYEKAHYNKACDCCVCHQRDELGKKLYWQQKAQEEMVATLRDGLKEIAKELAVLSRILQSREPL